MKKIITICGPTGVGKTGFAIRLAKEFNGEIIGADSMQIYKFMDIGTAKPDAEERAAAVHHLVDFLDPKEEFDAGKFAAMADRAIEDIHNRGKLPIVAGGTGLYIRALLHGLFRGKPICEETLEKLNRELEEQGGEALHNRLAACDPEAAGKIHPNDGFRIVRALEVFQTTGTPISQRQQDHDFKEERYQSLTLGLHMEREKLYRRINQRVDIMLDQGLLKEVHGLVEQGYPLELKSMQSIGYRQMGMFMRGEVDFQEAVRLLKRDTRRYAKRQFTWFKKEPGLVWVDPQDTTKALAAVKEFLT
ncbi:MAG: tRNA (adenosine(37)-N6)-dimethylallyltransferase MiaA [Desulfobacterales bacterium]|nr:tRNA (adenosine(37)-N6)-dimethylallyltransferase MiaA [Desulfobacterales bacterium]